MNGTRHAGEYQQSINTSYWLDTGIRQYDEVSCWWYLHE